jgi:hypothetical protein
VLRGHLTAAPRKVSGLGLRAAKASRALRERASAMTVA